MTNNMPVYLLLLWLYREGYPEKLKQHNEAIYNDQLQNLDYSLNQDQDKDNKCSGYSIVRERSEKMRLQQCGNLTMKLSKGQSYII